MRFTVRHVVNRLICVLALLLAGCSTPVLSPDGMTTTVVLIRHADRVQGNPELNKKGRERAQALVKAVADIPIQRIYSPNKKRNLDTVRPLSDARNIPISIVDISKVAERMVRENPGEAVLWVGNTSNLDGIFWTLGGEESGPNYYGEMFILKVSDTKLESIEKRHFGGSRGL